MPKLTLSVDEAVIGRAKRYAKKQGVSVSKMVEAYLSAVADPPTRVTADTPVLRSVRGILKKADAIDLGVTGPCLRGSGVDWDIRKSHPYSSYEDFDFEVPIGNRGDVYDRYLVRMEEMRQSLRIVEQALENLPEGPFAIDDRRITLPPKHGVYTNIEDLMNHFKLVMHGIQPLPGEVYGYTEAANGELGFYIVSDGSMRPWRVHCRGVCFPLFASFPTLIRDEMVADAIAALGSFNIIAGELDR